MIGFISKRNVRHIKMFLVSGKLEKAILFFSVSIFLVIEFTNDLYQVQINDLSSFFLKERLELSFNKLKSLDDWYNWLEQDFAESVLNTNVEDIQKGDKYIFGAPRIFNIYLDYPSVCMDYILKDDNHYSQSCFPQNQQQIRNIQAKQIVIPSDKSLCIESDCSEFSINNYQTINVQLSHISDSLSLHTFTATIKSSTREAFQNTIKNKLRKNQWFSTISSRSFGKQFFSQYIPNILHLYTFLNS